MVSQPHPHSTLVPPIAFSLHCRATSVKWVSTYCSKQYAYLCLLSSIGHFWNFLHNLVFVRTCRLIRSESAGMHQFQQFLGWKCWLKRGRQSDQAPTSPRAGAFTWHWPGRMSTRLFVDRVWLLGALHKLWQLLVSSQHRAGKISLFHAFQDATEDKKTVSCPTEYGDQQFVY